MQETNLKLIKSIIEENKNTEYGKKYNFSKIKNIEDYKNYVPISNYEDYELFVKRMSNGEANILTVYPIIAHLMTSGSEKAIRKLIPFSRKAAENMGQKAFLLRDKILNKYKKENKKEYILFIGKMDIDLNKELPKEMILSEMLYYFSYKNKIIDLQNFYGGPDLLFDIGSEDFLYEKIWISILKEDILDIESIYMFSILQFFIEFEKSYKDIISDIKKREINPDKKLSEKSKNYLLNLPISYERLEYVEKECEKGFEGIALRLWKNIKLITGITSKTFIYENKLLERYTKGISIDSFLFALSESFIGFPKEINSYSYAIDPTFSFYEFIPYNEDYYESNNNPEKTLLINEVEKDKLYELIITNLSGLYRYRTYDVIKIIEKNENELLFEFILRENLLLNIKQEKTTIKDILNVMVKMENIVPDILGFCIGATTVNQIATYFLFLFLDGKKELKLNIDELEKKFDIFLSESNCLYKKYRHFNYIGQPKIFIKHQEQFNKLKENLHYIKSHNKPKFIIPEPLLIDILKNEGYISC